MDEEPNPKVATEKCLLSTTLDPDFYRIGHTKARKNFLFSILSVQSDFKCSVFTCYKFILFCE